MHPITLQHLLSPAITLVSSLLLLLPKPRAASSDDDSALPQIRQIVVRRIRPRRALVIAAITALIVAFATDGGVLVAETLLRHPGASRRHHHRQNQPKESGRASHSWNWSEDSVSIAWAIYSLGNVLVWSAIGGWTIKTDHFIHGGLASVVGVAFVLESVLLGFVAKSVAIREKRLCFFGALLRWTDDLPYVRMLQNTTPPSTPSSTSRPSHFVCSFSRSFSGQSCLPSSRTSRPRRRTSEMRCSARHHHLGRPHPQQAPAKSLVGLSMVHSTATVMGPARRTARRRSSLPLEMAMADLKVRLVRIKAVERARRLATGRSSHALGVKALLRSSLSGL